MATDVEAPAAAARQHARCSNCGEPLLGPTCYACGQPVKGLVRHFTSIIGDFLDSVFDFDSRTMRTLGPLLARPGYLSNEYFDGHRVRYVSPVRLFVFLCIVAFFVLQFVVDTDGVGTDSIARGGSVAEVERMRDEAIAGLRDSLDSTDQPAAAAAGVAMAIAQIQAQADERIAWLRARDMAIARGEPPPPDPALQQAGVIHVDGGAWHATNNPVELRGMPDGVNAWLNRMIARGQQNIARVQQDPRLLVDTFLQTLPQTFFVLLPLFALLLKLAYLFKRRLYMEHLIVALHSHAFLCLALLLQVGIGALQGLAGPGLISATLGWLQVALWVWMPLYLLLMQKRVYRQGWLMTIIKFLLLGAAYLLLISIAVATNLMLNLVAL